MTDHDKETRKALAHDQALVLRAERLDEHGLPGVCPPDSLTRRKS